MEISPLSLTITYKAEGIRTLAQKEGVSIYQTELRASLVVTGIRYQDGSMAPQEYGIMSFGYPGDGKEFTLTQRFTAVADVEKIADRL